MPYWCGQTLHAWICVARMHDSHFHDHVVPVPIVAILMVLGGRAT